MKNKIIAAILAVFSLFMLSVPATVKADSYSSSDNRKTLSIDKKVRSMDWNYYLDNISSATKVFYNGEIIEFKVKVTNTGTTNMKNIKVTDQLPPFLKLIFYPGTYDSANNKVEWTIDELNAGNDQVFLIRAKIDKAGEVHTATKETNVSVAKVDEISAQDDSIYYIKSNGEKATVILPETGSMDLIWETMGVLTVGISGLALRKKIRGY